VQAEDGQVGEVDRRGEQPEVRVDSLADADADAGAAAAVAAAHQVPELAFDLGRVDR